MVGLCHPRCPITACATVSCRWVWGGLHHWADDEFQLRLCSDVQRLHRHHGRLQHVRYGQGVLGWVALVRLEESKSVLCLQALMLPGPACRGPEAPKLLHPTGHHFCCALHLPRLQPAGFPHVCHLQQVWPPIPLLGLSVPGRNGLSQGRCQCVCLPLQDAPAERLRLPA